MDYFNGSGLPVFQRRWAVQNQGHQQITDQETPRTQFSGYWRTLFGDNSKTRDNGIDVPAESRNPKRKSKTGIYVAFVVLVTLLVLSCVAIAVLSTLLFFKEDETIKGPTCTSVNLTERPAPRDPTYHCQDDTPKAKGCGDGWFFSGGSCYWHNHEKLSFDEAEVACRLLDATLVEITDAQETNVLNDFVNDITWIGAKYSEEAERPILSCSQESSSFINDQLLSSGDGPCIYTDLEHIMVSFTRSDCDTLMASVCEGNYVV